MYNLFSCSEYSSLHGVHHFVHAGTRKYRFRLLWAFIFLAFTLMLIYFQLNLLYDIVVKKPTVVERYYKRSESINFPNIVICDLNQEHDNFAMFTDIYYGNVSALNRLGIQLALNLLYEPIRAKFRQNSSRAADEYPILSKQYKVGYAQANPLWIQRLSK